MTHSNTHTRSCLVRALLLSVDGFWVSYFTSDKKKRKSQRMKIAILRDFPFAAKKLKKITPCLSVSAEWEELFHYYERERRREIERTVRKVKKVYMCDVRRWKLEIVCHSLHSWCNHKRCEAKRNKKKKKKNWRKVFERVFERPTNTHPPQQRTCFLILLLLFLENSRTRQNVFAFLNNAEMFSESAKKKRHSQFPSAKAMIFRRCFCSRFTMRTANTLIYTYIFGFYHFY